MKQGLAALAVLIALPFSAAANALDATFDSYLLGVKTGTLTVSGDVNGTRYEAKAVAKSAGLAAMITKFTFSAASKGRVRSAQLFPESYAERSDTGKRTSDRQIVWSGGVPKIIKTDKTRSYYVDPKTQKGTIDPMTMIFEALRDREQKDLCKIDLPMFDGARRVHVRLNSPAPNGETVVCQGLYRRVAGFSEKQKKEGTDFSFTVTYTRKGDIYQATQLDLNTVRGRAKFIRR